MSISSAVKQKAKMAYKHYRNNKFLKWNLEYINNKIDRYPEAIPELTDEEKKEITAFWKGKYGISFPLSWHRFFYGSTGVKDFRYIPETIFHKDIKPFFNSKEESLVWGDKSYMDFFLRGSKTVRSVVRNVDGRFLNETFDLITPEQVLPIMDSYGALVIKPSTNTDTGKGVQLLKKPYNLQAIIEQYKRNYVIQIPLRQHPDMAKLNASSVNTIRINSVLFETEAHVMSAFVKVGQTGEFADNHGHDRFFIGIHMNGTFCDFAINHDLQKFQSIPSGYDFAGKRVPSFDKVCAAIEEAHKKLAHFGFAFWDVCVDENGDPVIVEVNLRYPDTVIPQACGIGGFLGEYTEEVLNRYLRRGTHGYIERD